MIRDYHEFLKEVMIHEEKLQQRIKELGAEISRDYNGKPVLLV